LCEKPWRYLDEDYHYHLAYCQDDTSAVLKNPSQSTSDSNTGLLKSYFLPVYIPETEPGFMEMFDYLDTDSWDSGGIWSFQGDINLELEKPCYSE